jgi:hypothetical protein
MQNLPDYRKVYDCHPGMPWLADRTILLTLHGSHAYGTSLPTSDYDLKGVAVPTAPYFLGFNKVFEQAESKDPYDTVIYDVRKFCNLAADCNPNIIEVLWTEPSDYLVLTQQGEELLSHRKAFLSRKAKHTFSGYALSQLKRINTHYKWLVAPPAAPPTRAEYGLPERTLIPADQLAAAQAAIKKQLDSWELDLSALAPSQIQHIESQLSSFLEDQIKNDRWILAARNIGYDENFIMLLDRERQYNGRMKEWQQYQNWKATRNEARASLEAQFGYDTKHAGHLVRLLRMCREILTTGEVKVKRPDAQELLAIRHGAWKYEELVEWAKKEDEALSAMEKQCSILPKSPDREAIDKVCVKIVESMLL